MAKNPGSQSHSPPGPDEILREIQVNLLECKVCFEKFSTQQRPQNLSCGHVLCLECIVALSHPLLRKLECPFCRQLCSIDSTSHCQVLSDLRELLFSWSPTSSSSSSSSRAKRGLGEAAGLTATALHLCATFGGWGTLINPTGIAVLGCSGTIVVVHDGEKRVVVFSPQGKKLHSFGQRGRASGEICYPVGVAVSPCGYVVVTDAGDKAVKVFTSRGNHVLTVKDSFQMPWGVDTDSCGRILVTDVQAGTLSQIKVDFIHGVILGQQTVISDLQHPKAVACCQESRNTAVMEHLPHGTYPQGRQQRTRLRVFSKDFQLLYQTDSFSQSLQSTVRLNMSAVTFDEAGDVIVIDSNQGIVWSLGKLQNGPALTPLVGEHLIRPVGLVSLSNVLVLLDGGDHTVKIYSAKSDAGSFL